MSDIARLESALKNVDGLYEKALADGDTAMAETYRKDAQLLANQVKSYRLEQSSVLADTPTEAGAGFAPLVLENFADDPVSKMAIFAKHRFPDLEPEEAAKKYKIFPGGKIGYETGDIDPDTKKKVYYREKPETWQFLTKDIASAIPVEGAQLVGEAYGSAKGAAMGFKAAPPHPIAKAAGTLGGAIAGAGTAAAAGETAKQAVGQFMLGDEFDIPEVSDRMTEAAIGEVLGFGLAKLWNKARSGRFIDEVSEDTLKQVEEAQAKAAEYGFKLTPAEASNLNSLKAVQRYLLNHPVSSDIVGDFMNQRGLDINDSFEVLINRISDNPSILMKEAGAGDAVLKQLSKLKEARSDAAKPLYEKAYQESKGIDLMDTMTFIDGRIGVLSGKTKKKLTTVKGELFEEIKMPDGTVKKDLTTDMEKIHNVMQDLGDDINAAKNAGRAKQAMELTRVKKMLEGELETSSSYFKKAQKKWAEMSDPINKFETMYKPVIKSDDPSIIEIGNRLFGTKSTPEQVKQAKVMLSQQGEEGAKAFEDLAMGWVQHKVDNILLNENDLASPKKIKKAFFKNRKEQKMLEAALSPEQMQHVNGFLEVLSMASRAPSLGSSTAPNLEIADMMRSSPRLKGVVELLSNPVQAIYGALSDQQVDNATEALARAFVDPDAMRLLQKEIGILKSATSSVKAKQQALYSMGVKITQLQSSWDADNESQKANVKTGFDEGRMGAL